MTKKPKQTQLVMLNLGCGMWHGRNWVNVDGSLNVLLDNRPWLKKILRPILPASAKNDYFVGCRYMDLRRRWKFADNSVDVIYSSHFFEHLDFEAGQHVLRESFRVLKPNGTIRFVMPSIAHDVNVFLKAKAEGDPLAATRLAELVTVFPEPVRGPWWYRMLKRIYDKNTHKWFYDNESLAHYLQIAGFAGVTPRRHLQTEIPYLDEIEPWYKVDGFTCVEGKKPAAAAAGAPIRPVRATAA